MNARSVAIYLCRELIGASFKQIGNWFGGRDHSTVMHAYNKIKAVIQSEKSTNTKTTVIRLVDELKNQFSNSLEWCVQHEENLSTDSK